MKYLPLALTLPFWLWADAPVVPDEYQINRDDNRTYIYSDEYTALLPDIKAYQDKIINQYSQEYDFSLDERLYVGLASHRNQIANAFSTQIPFNSQLFYGAGAGYIDYFCFDSWLKTLLIHETAHNFQLNPKENLPSKLSHQVFGNTPFTILGFLPLFPIPNLTESNFNLEGNAVMNESRFGNGGRLYSGYALAELVALAQADLITPELMYNDTLNFPYGEKPYLIGGFFHQFLAKRYGVEKVNRYFKTYATQMLPLFTNAMFREAFGKDFETLLGEFVTEVKQQHAGFKPSNGKVMATSQIFVPMNRTEDECYTLISDRQSAPQVLSFNTDTHAVSYHQGAWQTGELFKIDDQYYTQSYAKTTPTQITTGLFDTNLLIKKGTESKAVQGIMPNGKAVYFDIPHSIETPHIYINGAFYDTAHSSVHIDDQGNLYYFKQEGQQRRLYKNKTPLFNYEGHYGFVTDVDQEGRIYFIAASEHGSRAYRYNGSTMERITDGDDVIDLKLINADQALIATIQADRYTYQTVPLQVQSTTVFALESGLEDNSSEITQAQQVFKETLQTPDSKHYQPLTNLHYSSLNQAMGYSSYDGFLLYLQANFSDPLMQNSLTALLSHEKAKTVGGLRYDNQAYPLQFGAEVFGVQQHEIIWDEQDHGYGGYLRYPFLAKGYWRGDGTIAYTEAYHTLYRKPISATLDLTHQKQFGISKYPNRLDQLTLFAAQDRDTQSYGGTYNGMHDLAWQSYLGWGGTYMQSSKQNLFEEKGIRIADSWGALQSERSEIIMPTIDRELYAKSAGFAEISLYKVFDTPIYHFSLPLSLRRETFYAKHRYYNFDLRTVTQEYHETIVGLESDLLFMHKIPLPISFEWLYNEEVTDPSQFRIFFSGEF